jgi:predicted RNA methylase
MLLPDLDRYYTPPAIARSVVEATGRSSSTRCLDSTCGDGSLLAAAREVLPSVRCIGMDVDPAAISRLRKRHPDWTLSRGDALDALSWERLRAGRVGIGSDLALLNPPFSMAATKGVVLALETFHGRCSVAMGHILTVLVRASPEVCCAVVPESLMYSDLDACARIRIRASYEAVVTAQLTNCTFRGTRANAVLVRFTRRRSIGPSAPTEVGRPCPRTLRLVRGGLPLFEARSDRRGVSYVHSTDLGRLTRGEDAKALRRVRPLQRGRVSGAVILLPRVGVPLVGNVRAVCLSTEVQLSDCVIALSFSSLPLATSWERVLRKRLWSQLVALYHGTGARYVTVDRLQAWLSSAEGHVERSIRAARGGL